MRPIDAYLVAYDAVKSQRLPDAPERTITLVDLIKSLVSELHKSGDFELPDFLYSDVMVPVWDAAKDAPRQPACAELAGHV